jgi:beta-glucosidase
MKNRTYRYFTGEPLFPFGYGLSYTTFSCRNLRLPKRITAGQSFKVAVDVENTGKISGEQVVELYVKTPRAEAIRSLQGFTRVLLRPGQRRTVEFTLQPPQFSHVTAEGRRRVEPGILQISVGGSQSGPGVLIGNAEITGGAKDLD